MNNNDNNNNNNNNKLNNINSIIWRCISHHHDSNLIVFSPVTELITSKITKAKGTPCLWPAISDEYRLHETIADNNHRKVFISCSPDKISPALSTKYCDEEITKKE